MNTLLQSGGKGVRSGMRALQKLECAPGSAPQIYKGARSCLRSSKSMRAPGTHSFNALHLTQNIFQKIQEATK